jgi:hypothetical protein
MPTTVTAMLLLTVTVRNSHMINYMTRSPFLGPFITETLECFVIITYAVAQTIVQWYTAS